MKPVRDRTGMGHYRNVMNVFSSILKYKQHVTVKHITAARLLCFIPRLKGHKSARTTSLGFQSFLVYAALSVCVCGLCCFSDLCASTFIVLLMVPLSSLRLASSQFAEEGLYSQQRQHSGLILTNQVEELLFEFCPECHKQKMSSIPQGAYAARKVRMNEDKNQVPNTNNMLYAKRKDSEKSTPQQPYYPHVYKKFLEQPPVKYNSKLMNSIWGLYNRYSVHNLKKVTEGEEAFQGVQQLASGNQRCNQTM